MKKVQNGKKNEVKRITLETLSEDFDKWFSPDRWKDLIMQTQDNFAKRQYLYLKEIRDTCMHNLRCKDGYIYGFNGKYWERVNINLVVMAIQNVLVDVRQYVTYKDFEKLQKRLNQVVQQGISVSVLQERHDLLGFQNGVWDFSDIDNPVYHPFADRCEITYLLDYDYCEGAISPTWENFLAQVLSNSQIETLQRFLGLGVVNRKKMGHKIEETLWLVGTGGNGKSVIHEIVHAVYGERNISDSGLLSLIKGNGDDRMRNVAAIEGKIFNYCSEVQANDISPYADAFKSLCSGEPQMIRRIGKDVEKATDIPFLIFNMNQKPSIKKIDHAIERRIRTITFDMQISPEDMKKDLAQDLKKELPGIRNWMIDGYKKLRKDGYRFTSDRDEEKERIETLEDNGQYVQLWMLLGGYRPNRYAGHWEEKSEAVSSSQLYNEFLVFCQKRGYEEVGVTMQMFARQLGYLGFKKKRTASCVTYEIFMDEKFKEKRRKLLK